MKIGIIGLGASGSNILKNIIDHENFNDKNDKFEIHVFETRQPSKGLPYEHDSQSKMLNIRAKKMSANPEDKDHLIRWLKENNIELGEEEVPSRNIYGDYLNDFFSQYLNHKQVTLHKAKVIDLSLELQEEKEIYHIKTEESKEYRDFDAVFMCLGHPSYNDFYKLKGVEGYIHTPYRLVEKLDHLDPNLEFGIIGSGASGIDLFRYFMKDKDLSKPLKIFVRSTAFKLAKIEYKGEEISPSITEDWIEDHLDKNNFLPIKDLLKTIKSDFENKQINFFDIYEKYKSESFDIQRDLLKSQDQDFAYIVEYFEILTPLYPYIFGNLSGKDQQIFMDKYDEKLELFRTLTPPKTIEWILEVIDKSKLEVIYDLQEVIKKEDGFEVVCKERSYKTDIIVNATGFDFKLENSFEQNHLLERLVKKDIIQSNEDGRYIDVIWPSCKINSPKYGELENLYALGMWIGGDHYRPNDMRSVLAVTGKVARGFMSK